jgi:hypothetical protein
MEAKRQIPRGFERRKAVAVSERKAAALMPACRELYIPEAER